MAWVKRNLVFVIIIAVGLIATGYCGYLLNTVVGANATVNADYTSTLEQLKTAQDAKPPASKENIEAAKADQERVREFLGDFKKAFAPFPIAPKVDDRGFVEHLQLTLRQFGMDATNAGVLLPPDYSFSFSQQRQKVSFPPECIDGWMQELEEVKLILRILYTAKINYLEHIQRVPSCDSDNYGDDVLNTQSLSNQWGMVTPYEVAFRGFSTEVASVLSGFADSSNCFVVKFVDIKPSRAALPQVIVPEATPQMRYVPQPEYNQDMPEDGGRGGRGYRRRPQPQQYAQSQTLIPAGPATPETILQETPLYITVVVDAVKLKKTESTAVVNAVRGKKPER